MRLTRKVAHSYFGRRKVLHIVRKLRYDGRATTNIAVKNKHILVLKKMHSNQDFDTGCWGLFDQTSRALAGGGLIIQIKSTPGGFAALR